MGTEKVTVTVPADVLAQARAAVAAGRARSLSAYVTEAVAERAERDRRASAIEERWGPFDADALAWANQIADRCDEEARQAR